MLQNAYIISLTIILSPDIDTFLDEVFLVRIVRISLYYAFTGYAMVREVATINQAKHY